MRRCFVLLLPLACGPSASTTTPSSDPANPSAGNSAGNSAGSPASDPAEATDTPPEADAPAAAAAGLVDPEQKAEIGKAAPDFNLAALDGTVFGLAQAQGKIVVLEWFNPQCPFVNYAHGEQGPLTTLAPAELSKGVVWYAINSGAPGKQGHGVEDNRKGAEKFGITYPILLDESGQVGHAYGAEKTPHLFVIDGQGVLQYAGGLDNAPFGETKGDNARRDHLVEALADVRAGKPVREGSAPAWGCSVKYGK